MYNPCYLPQLETFRADLFGDSEYRRLIPSARYFCPETLQLLSCAQDTNGEWVAQQLLEEKTTCSARILDNHTFLNENF